MTTPPLRRSQSTTECKTTCDHGKKITGRMPPESQRHGQRLTKITPPVKQACQNTPPCTFESGESEV
jgi:hypothetical protein